jgi:hypothetical protein
MSHPLGILSYAGRDPAAPRGFFVACWRAIVWTITATIVVVIVTLRAALLSAGFICVFAGLILLTLGGKVSAGRKLLEWRARFVDLSRLWLSDMARPFRRARRDVEIPSPLPVVTVTPQ